MSLSKTSTLILAISLSLIVSTCTIGHAKGVKEAPDAWILNAVATADLSDIVPLLFVVGPPADAGNFQTSSNFNEFVRSSGLAGYIFNSYHYYASEGESEQNTLNRLRVFNNEIRSSALDRVLRLPPLMMVDYESYEFSSLQRLKFFPHLPSAQSLAATRNSELIRTAGGYAGLAMKQLGFNVMLGPVLDTQQDRERGHFSSTHTRSFSTDRNVLLNTAANFMHGLSQSGVITIGKHLPGIGSVSENPHKHKDERSDISLIDTTKDVFEDDLDVFRAFIPYTDGIMTSHVAIKPLTRNVPVTVDRFFINRYVRSPDISDIDSGFIGFGAKNMAIITDDISDMGSILKYKQDNNLSWPKIVRNMIEAGHDLILISHFSDVFQVRYGGDFTTNDLREVISYLVTAAESDSKLEETIRSAAGRVLALKVKALSAFAPHYDPRSPSLDHRSFEVDRVSVDELRRMIENYIENENFERRLVTEAFSNVSGKVYDFHKAFDGGNDICIAPDSRRENFYKEAFSSQPQVRVVGVISRTGGDRSIFDEQKDKLTRLSFECDYLFVEIVTREQIDYLDEVRLRGRSESVIGLLHGSPLSLPDSFFSSFKLYGSFTTHPSSYDVNVDFILGNILAKPVINVPVPVGARPVHSLIPELPSDGSFKDLRAYARPVASAQASQIETLQQDISARDVRIRELREKEAELLREVTYFKRLSASVPKDFSDNLERHKAYKLSNVKDLSQDIQKILSVDEYYHVETSLLSDDVIDYVELSDARLQIGDEKLGMVLLRAEGDFLNNPLQNIYLVLFLISAAIFVFGAWLKFRALHKSRKKKTIMNIITCSPSGFALLLFAFISFVSLYFVAPKDEIFEDVDRIFDAVERASKE